MPNIFCKIYSMIVVCSAVVILSSSVSAEMITMAPNIDFEYGQFSSQPAMFIPLGGSSVTFDIGVKEVLVGGGFDNIDIREIKKEEERKKKIVEKLNTERTPRKINFITLLEKQRRLEEKRRGEFNQIFDQKEKVLKIDWNEERGNDNALISGEDNKEIKELVIPKKQKKIVDVRGMIKRLPGRKKANSGNKKGGKSSSGLSNKKSKKRKEEKKKKRVVNTANNSVILGTRVIKGLSAKEKKRLSKQDDKNGVFRLNASQFWAMSYFFKAYGVVSQLAETLSSASKEDVESFSVSFPKRDPGFLEKLKKELADLNDKDFPDVDSYLGFLDSAFQEIQRQLPSEVVEEESRGEDSSSYYYLSGKQVMWLIRALDLFEKAMKKKTRSYVPSEEGKGLRDGRKVLKEYRMVKHAGEDIRCLIYEDLDKLIPEVGIKFCLSGVYKNASELGWNIYTTGSQGIYIAVLHFNDSTLARKYIHILTGFDLPAQLSWNKAKERNVISVLIDLNGEEKIASTKKKLKQAKEALEDIR